MSKLLKRIFDICCSFIGLVLLSPTFLILSVFIIGDSQGEIFFRGVRTGKDGKPFRIFKFRTMVKDAEGRGKWNISDSDPRLTRIGAFLRRTKLDELPQLINVLKGEMSLVGPRPELQYYTNMFSENEQIILQLKPGITDWASIVHIDQHIDFTSSYDPDKVYIELIRPLKLELQKYYIKNHSFISDVKIILWTLYKVIFRNQALPKDIEGIVNRYRIAGQNSGVNRIGVDL